jgi:electron transport complex protein RnfD
MKFSTAASPYLHSEKTVSQQMLQVLQALCPAILLSVVCFGVAVLIQLGLAIVTALVAECGVFWLRKRPLTSGLSDLSATVTAVLLALSLPVSAPWWLSVNGTLFALLVGKHIYGGLGYNPFNPAMVGYAFLLISFPQPMTAWLAFDAPTLTLLETWQWIFTEQLPIHTTFDALTRATPLDTLKTQLRLQQSLSHIHSLPVFGWLAGKSYQWIALAYLGGGLWLLKRKVIGWQIPTAVLASLSLLASLGFMYDAEKFSSPLLHIFAGSTLLGAFFIATDPVTAATSQIGRLIYGGLIGVLLYCIRTWGGYPDGMAFAVLLANLTVPTLDYYTRPKVYGQS